MKNVLSKLNTLRMGIAKENIKKSGYNTFSKAHYYELSDFMGLVLKASKNLNISTIFSVKGDTASLLVYDIESGESVEFTAPFSESTNITDKAQANGAGLTYVRRYLYVNMLELVENDELDAKDYTKKEEMSTERSVETVQQNQTKDREIKYWDGQSPIQQFDHFYIGDIEYVTMKNKNTGELFGLAVDEKITGTQKFYKFQ
jgi:hypothetical protein